MSRYRHLNPKRFSSSFVSGRHNEGINDPLGFASATQTLQMNSDLTNYNGVRVATMIQALPFYQAFKFAITGAFFGCASPSEFMTEDNFQKLRKQINFGNKFSSIDAQESTKKKFIDLVQIKKRGSFGSATSLIPNGVQECALNGLDCLAFHQKFWDNDPILFGLAVDTIEKQGYDRMVPESAVLRLIFEGQGIDMSNWWADFRQPTYRTNAGFASDWSFSLQNLDPSIPKKIEFISDQQYCDQLKPLSRSAMSNYSIPNLPNPIDKPSVDYPAVFKNTCAKCHVEQQVAPRIPFDNQVKMNAWVQLDKNLSKIQYRVYDADEFNSMPPTRVLTDVELQQINQYLIQFR